MHDEELFYKIFDCYDIQKTTTTTFKVIAAEARYAVRVTWATRWRAAASRVVSPTGSPHSIIAPSHRAGRPAVHGSNRGVKTFFSRLKTPFFFLYCKTIVHQHKFVHV